MLKGAQRRAHPILVAIKRVYEVTVDVSTGDLAQLPPPGHLRTLPHTSQQLPAGSMSVF